MSVGNIRIGCGKKVTHAINGRAMIRMVGIEICRVAHGLCYFLTGPMRGKGKDTVALTHLAVFTNLFSYACKRANHSGVIPETGIIEKSPEILPPEFTNGT